MQTTFEEMVEREKRLFQERLNQRPTMVVYVGSTDEAEWLNVSLTNGAEVVARHVLENAVVYELIGAHEIRPSKVPLAGEGKRGGE